MYETMGILTGSIVAVIVLISALIQIVYQGYYWVNDSWDNLLYNRQIFLDRFYDTGYELDDFWLFHLISLLLALVAGLAWPLFWVSIFVTGSMFLLRTTVRFKKKVNTAFDTKADKDHNHD